MRSELIALRMVVVLAAVWAFAGCSSAPKCGAGTIDKDGVCVLLPAIKCGEGTVAQGGTCVSELPDGTVACNPACSAVEACDPSGVCVPAAVPGNWTCASAKYRDGVGCDCGCGAPDPDCTIAEAPVSGCLSGACKADGTCVACVPKCDGKACGDDGCGGSCGSCFDPSKIFCIGGQCAACTPDCADKTCGPDGCGGVCGTCGVGHICTLGKCDVPPPEASCSGRCGAVAPSGCSCQGECAVHGDCCADVDLCGCQPSCGQRVCGDDGCGGACGHCATAELCVAGACKANACDPDPCSSNGSCHLPEATCTCRTAFGGDHCDQCEAGYVGYPNCTKDFCAALGNTCGGHGTCQPASGACECSAGFQGTNCSGCATGHGTYPNCTP